MHRTEIANNFFIELPILDWRPIGLPNLPIRDLGEITNTFRMNEAQSALNH